MSAAQVAVVEAAQAWDERERLQVLEGCGNVVQPLDDLNTGYASAGCGTSGRRKKLLLLTLSLGALREAYISHLPC